MVRIFTLEVGQDAWHRIILIHTDVILHHGPSTRRRLLLILLHGSTISISCFPNPFFCFILSGGSIFILAGGGGWGYCSHDLLLMITVNTLLIVILMIKVISLLAKQIWLMICLARVYKTTDWTTFFIDSLQKTSLILLCCSNVVVS